MRYRRFPAVEVNGRARQGFFNDRSGTVAMSLRELTCHEPPPRVLCPIIPARKATMIRQNTTTRKIRNTTTDLNNPSPARWVGKVMTLAPGTDPSTPTKPAHS